MLLDIEQLENQVTFSFFNEVGEVELKTYSTTDFPNWYICEDTDKRRSIHNINWDGKPVRASFERKISKHGLIEFIERLPKEDSEKIFGYNFPKTFFFDIETEVTDGFPEPELANNKILTISVVTPNHQVIVLGLKDFEQKSQDKVKADTNKYFEKFGIKWDIKYIKFNTEYDLVYTFVNKFMPKFPMLSGWNCINFDWKYIVNRCKRLQIDPAEASPTGTLTRDGLPYHIGIVDYMDLYSNWDRSIAVKENNQLNTAAMQTIGVGKIKYDGGLQQLYEDDYQKYLYYNAVDSILVYLMDQKLKTLQVVLTLSNICKISFYKAGSPVAITESLISRNLLAEGKVMAVKPYQKEKEKNEQYTGAFVKQPVVGKHRAVACFDFASLYPSIMRQFNISPDSYVDMIPQSKAGDYDKSKYTVTSAGGVYVKEPSILKRVLTDLYAKRREYKKSMFEYKMELEKISEKLKEKA
jgi:DNA polymerase elongation subunit (family B)